MGTRLRVSANKRFLQQADGAPFFYLGDTAWELFHRLTFAEADHYLRDRAAKGFNVIQAVALAELDGLRTPNANGHLPFEDCDPARPVEAYWAHVDRVVARANELGLFVGFLPTWGDKWFEGIGAGPVIFTPDNARAYGRWLGRRYAAADLIWILGGDRAVETDTHRTLLRAMAEGLGEGDGGNHLMTLHPRGGKSSADFVHEEAWLDFNIFQSGHCDNSLNNYTCLERDYARRPVKPTFDAEPCYEDHPIMTPEWKRREDGAYYGDHEVRRAAYWAVFSGGCGHTYGCHPIWMMWDHGRPPVNGERRPWHEALHLPGAGQMRHVKDLMLSRPYFSRLPDASAVKRQPLDPLHHIAVTRDGRPGSPSASYLLAYTPVGQPFPLDLSMVDGRTLNLSWFNPRNGGSVAWKTVPHPGSLSVTLADYPEAGPDWVLCVDRATDAARPGANTIAPAPPRP